MELLNLFETSPSPQQIGTQTRPLLQAIAGYDSAQVLTERNDLHHILDLRALVAGFSAADPETVATAAAAWLAEHDDPDALGDWIMDTAVFINPVAPLLPEPVLRALARATAGPAAPWLFPRYFPPRKLYDYKSRAALHAFDLAFREIMAADVGRRIDGLALLVESFDRAVGYEKVLDELTRPRVDAPVEESVRFQTLFSGLTRDHIIGPPEQRDEATSEQAALRMWQIARSDWRIYHPLVDGIVELCASPAVASRIADHLLAETATTRESPRCKSALFRLLARARRADEMRQHAPDASWESVAAIADVYEELGRTDDAIAVVEAHKPSAKRNAALKRLKTAAGRGAEALAHVTIEPEDVDRLARELGIDAPEIERVGRERAKDKGPWLELALRRGAFDDAAQLATESFHPERLDALLGASPAIPADLAFRIAARVLELALAPSTVWDDEARAKQVASAAIAAALEFAPDDKARARFVATTGKKLDRLVAKTRDYFLRELAFSVQDLLAQRAVD